MRVLYFTAQDSPHDRRFLHALAETTHQVFCLRMQACQPKTPEGITALEWPAGWSDWSCWRGWLGGLRQFKSILTELQPDLVHAGPIQGPAFLSALAEFHPLVSMSWGFDILRIAKRSPWMREVTSYTLQHSDVLVADCQTVATEAAAFGFPSERMVRFPWGVDLAHFSPLRSHGPGLALKRSLGWEAQFVIFCNRSWSKPYGVDLLAQAFVDACQTQTNLRLLLAGDGPLSDHIYKILAPINETVYFPGWVAKEDLPQYYGAGDLFVSPSHYDGSSVSLMEALACGRPVLVSDIPSNQEWVRPGVAGDWFRDGEVASLAKKLQSMASDPNIAEYGKRARRLAEARADWDVNFKQLEVAYQMALI